jgi:hypothetical protein
MIRTAFIRIAGYALSSAVAWVFYLGWIAAELRGSGSFQDRLVGALFLSIFGGFSAALVMMILPWAFTVWLYRKVQQFGAVYFACAGALLTIPIGCAASSMSPKPLFIEDQTFLEGMKIALERQGLCLALAGMFLGLGYWFIAERNVAGACRLGRPA